MYEIFNAGSLQLVAACRCTCNHEQRLARQLFVCGDGILGILLVARTDNHHVGLSLQCGLDALVNRGKSQVVYYLVAGNAEEIAE